MAVDVVTSIEIGAPRDRVADFAADPDNATAWYRNIELVEWVTPPPLAVGTQLRFVAKFLGRRLRYVYEVRAHEPGLVFEMATADGPFPMRTIYRWEEATQGGTRMTLRNVGEPSGFAAVSAPLMERSMRRANQGDLRLLKGILEARTPTA